MSETDSDSNPLYQVLSTSLHQMKMNHKQHTSNSSTPLFSNSLQYAVSASRKTPSTFQRYVNPKCARRTQHTGNSSTPLLPCSTSMPRKLKLKCARKTQHWQQFNCGAWPAQHVVKNKDVLRNTHGVETTPLTQNLRGQVSVLQRCWLKVLVDVAQRHRQEVPV